MAETRKEILDAVAEVLADVTNVSVADVQLDKTLTEDLDVDSLSLAELGVALQDRFGIEISDERVVELSTVADVVEVIYGAKVLA